MFGKCKLLCVSWHFKHSISFLQQCNKRKKRIKIYIILISNNTEEKVHTTLERANCVIKFRLTISRKEIVAYCSDNSISGTNFFTSAHFQSLKLWWIEEWFSFNHYSLLNFRQRQPFFVDYECEKKDLNMIRIYLHNYHII